MTGNRYVWTRQVSDLILGRDDKEGNKTGRSAMRTIKHSKMIDWDICTLGPLREMRLSGR